MGEPCRCDAAMQDHLQELEALEVIHGHVGQGVSTRWERCAGGAVHGSSSLSWENGPPRAPTDHIGRLFAHASSVNLLNGAKVDRD